MKAMATQGSATRHAGVVPAAVAALVSKQLRCRLGTVAPAELTAWHRPGDPTESVRDELLQCVLRQLGTARAASLGSMMAGVTLPSDWETRLITADVKALRRMVDGCPQGIGIATLADLARHAAQSLPQLLRLLARVEALDWTPPPAPTPQAQPVQPVPAPRRPPCRTSSDGHRTAAKVRLPLPVAPAWHARALNMVRRDVAFIGCCSMYRVAGWLALETRSAPGREAIETMLAGMPGMRWLDSARNWFTVGDGGASSAAAARVRKVMAVATEAVSVDEIAATLLNDDSWMARQREREPAMPALHVLRELLAGWNWLSTRQHNRFLAREPVCASVLSPLERTAVRVIAERGGIAARCDLVQAIMACHDVTLDAVNFMLGGSPIIARVEHGLYALLGRRTENTALALGRSRLRNRLVGSADGDAQATGFRLLVTPSSLAHEQYSIPPHFRPRFAPGALKLRDGAGELWVGRSGVLRRLKCIHPDSRPGDAYWVEVAEAGITVTLEPGWCLRRDAGALQPQRATQLAHSPPRDAGTQIDQEHPAGPSAPANQAAQPLPAAA